LPKQDYEELEIEWKNPPKLRDLKHDFTESLQFQQSQVEKITEYLDNLHITGNAKRKKVKGKSSIVPQMIRKQAEWRYPALSEPFLTTSKLFSATGKTWEDTDAAEQNALLLNHQFNTSINKNLFIDSYVRSAVDTGTAIIKIGWENEEEEITELVDVYRYILDPTFEPTLIEAAELQNTNPNGYYELVPGYLQKAVDYYIQTGQSQRPELTEHKQEILRNVVIKNNPTLELCDLKNVYVDPTCLNNVDNAGFVIHRFLSDLATLKKDERYFNLDSLEPTDGSFLLLLLGLEKL